MSSSTTLRVGYKRDNDKRDRKNDGISKRRKLGAYMSTTRTTATQHIVGEKQDEGDGNILSSSANSDS